MVATKEQERKALEKIRKIVEELGEESYIGMAFEGCFEDAEENINNDFGLSWKDRAEKAGRELERLREETSRLADELGQKDAEVAKLQKQVFDKAELVAMRDIFTRDQAEHKGKAAEAAAEIVKFADNPESGEFIQAVEINRREATRAEMTGKLIESVNKKFNV